MDMASKIVKEAGRKLSEIQADMQTGKLTAWEALKKAYQAGLDDCKAIYTEATSYDGK